MEAGLRDSAQGADEQNQGSSQRDCATEKVNI
jgi:hypothetical protein